MKRLLFFTVSFFMALMLNAQDLLTVEKTLEIALQNSPDIRQSENAVQRSLQNLNAQKARQKSQFSLNANPLDLAYENVYDQDQLRYYDRQFLGSGFDLNVLQPLLFSGGQLQLRNSFNYSFDQNNNPNSRLEDLDGDGWKEFTSYRNDLRLSFTQPLFTYNTLKVEYEELQLDYENSAIQFALTKLNMERQVRQLFYSLYQQQQSLIISEEELRNNEESYEIIKNKVEGGLSALEELYQAELNLETSRSDLYNQQVALANAKDQFLYQIGKEMDFDFMVVANIAVEKISVDQNLAVDYALKNRMELRQREIDIQNSNFSLMQAKTRNEFRGDVQASVGVTNRTDPNDPNGDFNTMFENPSFTPQISFTFDIPLFDWGERKATIESAELALENSRMNLEFQEIEIILGIREIIRNLTNLYNQVEIARKSLENAQLTYDINLERYKNGDLTSMDLRLFQNQLTGQKNSLTSAIINYNLELLNLKIQTLYDFEKNEPIIPEIITNNKE